VADIDRIAQDMLRVTMSAAGIETLKWVPAQDFTLLVTRAGGRDIRRRYTIAGQHGDTVWFDLYVHGQGIGTSWATALRAGDTVSGIGPRGKFLLEHHAEWLLLIGDETSLPGILAMLAVSDRPARVVVEVDNAEAWSHLGAEARADTEWTWLSRKGVANSRCLPLAAATRMFRDRPSGCATGAAVSRRRDPSRRLSATRPTGAQAAQTQPTASHSNSALSQGGRRGSAKSAGVAKTGARDGVRG
jgi:NADPH-dependent ferric siderophore reductase